MSESGTGRFEFRDVVSGEYCHAETNSEAAARQMAAQSIGADPSDLRRVYDSGPAECGACGDKATHEVQPPKSDRDEWLPVCETHADELRPISAGVRPMDGDRDD